MRSGLTFPIPPAPLRPREVLARHVCCLFQGSEETWRWQLAIQRLSNPRIALRWRGGEVQLPSGRSLVEAPFTGVNRLMMPPWLAGRLVLLPVATGKPDASSSTSSVHEQFLRSLCCPAVLAPASLPKHLLGMLCRPGVLSLGFRLRPHTVEVRRCALETTSEEELVRVPVSHSRADLAHREARQFRLSPARRPGFDATEHVVSSVPRDPRSRAFARAGVEIVLGSMSSHRSRWCHLPAEVFPA